MPDPKTETTPFQSHSNTDDYLAAPCVFMDTNPGKYQKENHRYPSSTRSQKVLFVVYVQ